MKNLPTTYVYFVRTPLLFLITCLVVMGTFSKRGWMDWQRIRSENDRLEQKIASTEKEKSQIEGQIALLQHDREAQERAVRQVLGYIKPNETVIEFQ